MAVHLFEPGGLDSLWPCYSCCRQIWIPSLGQFSPQCLGVVGHIPLWIAIITVTLRYGLGPAWSAYRPIWLRGFAAEKDALPLLAPADHEVGDGPAPGKPWTAWTVSVLLLNVLSAVLSAIGASAWPEQAQMYLVPLLPCLISGFVLLIERPRTAPGPTFIINSIVLVVMAAILALMPHMFVPGWPQIYAWIAGVLPPFASILVMINMPLRDPLLDSSGISQPFSEPNAAVRSPEDVVTIWQWMSTSWLGPLIKIGYQRQLEVRDVWLLPYQYQHTRLHLLFREVPGTVLGRLLKVNGADLIITTSLGVLETCLELSEPVLLKQLLSALTAEEPNVRTAAVYAGITLLMRLIKTQSGVFNIFYCRRTYERTRGELITMIHEKTLRRKAFTIPSGGDAPAGQPEQQQGPPSPTPGISTATTLTDDEFSSHDGNETDGDAASTISEPSKLQRLKLLVRRLNPRSTRRAEVPPAFVPASTGKVFSLFRSDTYEISQRFWDAPSLTTKPLNFILSLILLWRILGRSSLFGILILISGMLVNFGLTRLALRIERARRKVTDAKLQRTTQFVDAIRHLRYYDWHDSWLESIMKSRQEELHRRIQSNVVTKTIEVVNTLSAYLFPVAGFWAYTVLSGKELTVDVAFPALDLFGMLQTSLKDLPGLVMIYLNASVAMGRVEEFMLEPEKEEMDVDLMDAASGPLVVGEVRPPGELEIILQDASFSWPGVLKKVLRNVSIECRPGLTLVCGKVGIGKTALLQAILGELDQLSGERIVPQEMIGYCSQGPWLESMSIRQNILFSSVYDKARFEQVIDACCLRDDLNMFKCKDLTLIGENGVGLSGGQKARVALARAVYSQARILILDDPIAALDHHTATAILENLFGPKNSSLTAGRLVIFVTHRVDIVTPYAYQVIEVMKGGRVESFDKKELENNEEELEHLAKIASAAAPAEEETTTTEDEGTPDNFIEDEHRVHGGVMASVYWQYVKAGRLGWWATMIGFFTLYRIIRVGYFWFLKEWGEQYQKQPAGLNSVYLSGLVGGVEDRQNVLSSRNAFGAYGDESSNGTWLDLRRYLPSPSENVSPWLVGFLILSMLQVITQTFSDAALVVIIYKAGKNLFERAMHRVTNATFRFYDVTPVGRLMNRLTSDMGTVDGQIASQLMSVTFYSLGWLSSIFVIGSTTPSFLVISLVMTGLFIAIFNRFLPTSQSLRRLETVSLSPLFSNFGTLIEGLTTVRAYRSEPHFQNRVIKSTDAFQNMDHMYWCLQNWLQFRFDLLSAISTFVLTITAIMSGLSSGTVGFVLASASNFVSSTHNLCRRYGEMQMQFVSVERVVELLDLDQEPEGTVRPPASWPHYGDDIVFDNATIRYAPTFEPVLKNLSFTIPGGANVAVTGRTGSGKSTLALTLLGTLHPDDVDGSGQGSIRIGGVDLSTVDKHVLRRNITFVPQDPVLFPGTLRDNLDPLGSRDEGELADVLERVLNGSTGSGNSTSGFTLDSCVDGGGKNLSQGQRQLVGLGRAILRRSPVVIMDEATASIDAETAAYIQRLLREELRYSTVITIAHKAEAVQDSDFEVVLDQGRVVRAGPRGKRLVEVDEAAEAGAGVGVGVGSGDGDEDGNEES